MVALRGTSPKTDKMRELFVRDCLCKFHVNWELTYYKCGPQRREVLDPSPRAPDWI